MRRTASKNINVIAMIPIIICMVIFGGVLFGEIIDMEHYYRVYKNGIDVVAEVTKHDSYDDEGDTDYRSYISYEIDGIRYENLEYEDKDGADQLSPIGKKITVQVSPENHAKLISKLANGPLLLGACIFICIFICVIYAMIYSSKMSCSIQGMPGDDTVQKDIRLKLGAKTVRTFWILMCFICVSLVVKYPLHFAEKTIVLAILFGCFAFICLYKAIRNYGYAKTMNYEIRRDTIVKKDETSDSDGDTTYKIYYNSNGNAWEDSVSKKYYEEAKEGNVVYSVYLPNSKRPIVYYDINGDAR